MTTFKRVMYCITSKSGQFMVCLAPDGPVFSPMAVEAVITRNAWMEATTAIRHAKEISERFPGSFLGIGLLELEGNANGDWSVTSSRCFPLQNTTPELIS
jgi:hypothetical protein